MKNLINVAGATGTLLLGMSLGLGCVVHETRYSAPPPPPPAAQAPAPAPAAPVAPPPGPAASTRHPAYLHALSDLRNARANLERKGGDRQMKWDEHDAIVEIDRAIHEIKEAAIDDGKNIDDHPPVDAREPREGRLHKALAALRAARADVEKEEDNAYANGLRGRAIHNIDEAIRFTEAGIHAAEQHI